MRETWLALGLMGLIGCTTQPVPEPPVPPSSGVEEPTGPVVTLLPSNEGLERQALWRQNLCLADINRDGHLDIVAPPPRGEPTHPYVFLGDGRGGWREWTEAVYPRAIYNYGGVDVGDVDLNGLPDLALGMHMTRVRVLLQDQPGVFVESSTGFPSSDQFTSRTVGLGDLVGDAKLELVAVSESPVRMDGKTTNPIRQKVFELAGREWRELKIFPGNPPPQSFGDSLTLGDFNGDGRLDFATASNVFGYKKVLFLNEGDGFQAYDIPAITDQAYLFNAVSADFDRDGALDLAYTAFGFDFTAKDRGASKDENAKAFLQVLFKKGEGYEPLELVVRMEGRTKKTYRGLAAADFDGNGFPDLATVNDDGQLYLLLNRGGRQFDRARVPGWVPHGKVSWLGAGDINEDGRPDLVAAYGTEKGVSRIFAYIVKP